MKIVVATDSFKGCMTSTQAGEIMARAFREQLPSGEIVVIPMADGGEGTTEAVLSATGGELRTVRVAGPLGEPVDASFGLLPDGRTVVMEMAAASGIELISPDELDPMRATTFGTGELIRAGLAAGAREIVIGVGGSATVDGGVGMARALGYRLFDETGGNLRPGGGALASLSRIESTSVVPTLFACRLRVASDVTNPLLGSNGAARVFGPQKGATPKMVDDLERGLAHLAGIWRREGLLDSVDRPGDGSAGGLGAGLRAFCRAELGSGAELVAGLTGFDDEIRDADLLVTGEGRTDEQTAGGKLPAVLAARAKMTGVRTILISGTITGDTSALDGFFDATYSTVDDGVSSEQAIDCGRENLARRAREVAVSVVESVS
ncbi:MAG: glycerate kinase [Thermoanaerobaculales bacterium]|jgi:glycerate kinase|nr:glycerate kinase [Thermoanaerobaculales bacterium]